MIGITVTDIANIDKIIEAWEGGKAFVPDQARNEVVVNARQIIIAEPLKWGTSAGDILQYTRLSLSDGIIVNAVEEWPEIRASILEEARALKRHTG